MPFYDNRGADEGPVDPGVETTKSWTKLEEHLRASAVGIAQPITDRCSVAMCRWWPPGGLLVKANELDLSPST